MHKPIRVLLILALFVGLATSGCGGTSSALSLNRLGFPLGPFYSVLPFLPDASGETGTLVLSNIASKDAPVFVSAFDPLGVPYGAPSFFSVPAQGALRVPLGSFTAAPAGGYLWFDSRDAATIDPVTGLPTVLDTSGLVFASFERERFGLAPATETLLGMVPRTFDVSTTITPDTTSVQLVNLAYTVSPPAAPTFHPLTYNLKVYDEFGALLSDFDTTVPAMGTFTFSPAAVYGQVRVTPMPLLAPVAPAGTEINHLITQQEFDFFTAPEGNFFYKHAATLFDKLPAEVDYGFEVDFGNDEFGNTCDFGMTFGNPTDSDLTITLQAIYSAGGLPILTAPRTFSIDPWTTVHMATDDALSFGLELGESGFFDDIFGPVALATTKERVALYFQAPREMLVQGRNFDPGFSAFHLVLPSLPRTNQVVVPDMPFDPVPVAGRDNLIILTNTTTGDLTVRPRLFTPIEGTEYLLDQVIVPAQSRVDFKLDGIQLREFPTDLTGPFVRRALFEVPAITGLFGRARTIDRNGIGLIETVVARTVIPKPED